jgi:hypothetical protein
MDGKKTFINFGDFYSFFLVEPFGLPTFRFSVAFSTNSITLSSGYPN